MTFVRGRNVLMQSRVEYFHSTVALYSVLLSVVYIGSERFHSNVPTHSPVDKESILLSCQQKHLQEQMRHTVVPFSAPSLLSHAPKMREKILEDWLMSESL